LSSVLGISSSSYSEKPDNSALSITQTIDKSDSEMPKIVEKEEKMERESNSKVLTKGRSKFELLRRDSVYEDDDLSPQPMKPFVSDEIIQPHKNNVVFEDDFDSVAVIADETIIVEETTVTSTDIPITHEATADQMDMKEETVEIEVRWSNFISILV
jgi:hypothetical protein